MDPQWVDVDVGIVDCQFIKNARESGRIPYFVIGDSHSIHYFRPVSLGTKSLGPLGLVLGGGSAMGLANVKSRSGYRGMILRWAENAAEFVNALDVPVFLKFGQVDVEFVWAFRRLAQRRYKYEFDDFHQFTKESVGKYQLFIKDFARIINPQMMRICSIFPPVLSDLAWTEGYVNGRIGFLEEQDLATLKEEIRKLEIPNLAGRTNLHNHYNLCMAEMCAAEDLIYVDDFSCFLDATGSVDERYLGEHEGTDHHLDFDAAEQPIVNILRRFVGPR